MLNESVVHPHLTSVTIPTGDPIPSGVTIPPSVISIGPYAFSGCTSITSVTITSSVTSIMPYAF